MSDARALQVAAKAIDSFIERCANLERQLAEADGVIVELWGRLTKEEIDIMPEGSKQRVYPYLARILKEE